MLANDGAVWPSVAYSSGSGSLTCGFGLIQGMANGPVMAPEKESGTWDMIVNYNINTMFRIKEQGRKYLPR